MRKWRDAG
jgi:hypothetical protein